MFRAYKIALNPHVTREIMTLTPLQGARAPGNAAASNAAAPGFWGADGLTFSDLLDAVNPLNHLPVISDFYRQSGQPHEVSHGARMLGGALFGGPLGMLSAFLGTVVEEATGDTPSGHLTALLNHQEPPQSFPAGEKNSVPLPAEVVEVAALPPLPEQQELKNDTYINNNLLVDIFDIPDELPEPASLPPDRDVENYLDALRAGQRAPTTQVDIEG